MQITSCEISRHRKQTYNPERRGELNMFSFHLLQIGSTYSKSRYGINIYLLTPKSH